MTKKHIEISSSDNPALQVWRTMAVSAPGSAITIKRLETFLTTSVSPPQLHCMQTWLEKRDREKNQTRFYCMAVMPNLFGEWTLRREWGSIGASGQVRLDLFRSEAEAEEALLAMENRKRRRGYYMEPQQLPMFRAGEIRSAPPPGSV